MKTKDISPLGYVDVVGATKAILPMNDVFINFTFSNPNRREALKQAINLIIEAYQQSNPGTSLKTIEGSIKVRTQYQYFLSTDKEATKSMDLEITAENGSRKYVEFQSQIDAGMATRAVDYLLLSQINRKPADNIWLLADDVDALLNGKTFSRFVYRDEDTGKELPNGPGNLYVSLTGLAKLSTPAGELAAFLLGRTTDPKDESVKEIAETFKASFIEFSRDTDAARALSRQV